MSIYHPYIKEYYSLSEQKPAWMKAERYEYCEQLGETAVRSKRLLNTIGRLFAIL